MKKLLSSITLAITLLGLTSQPVTAEELKLSLDILNSYSNFDKLDKKDTPSYGVGVRALFTPQHKRDPVKGYFGVGFSVDYMAANDENMSILSKTYTKVEVIAGVEFYDHLLVWGSIGGTTLTDEFTESTTFNAGVDLELTKYTAVGVFAKYWEWTDPDDNYLYGSMHSYGIRVSFTFPINPVNNSDYY